MDRTTKLNELFGRSSRSDAEFQDRTSSRRTIKLDSQALQFEQLYPDIFELFEKVGIHPTRPTPLAVGEREGLPFPHRPNIGLHSVAVAVCARALSFLIGPHPRTPGVDVNMATRRALLHDIGKPFEIMQRDLLKEPRLVYSDKAQSDLHKLALDYGMSDKDAFVIATAGSDAGHLSVKRFLYVDNGGNVRVASSDYVSKIVHISDSIVETSVPPKGELSVTTLIPPRERLLGDTSRQRYPWLWEVGLALDADREVVEIQNIRSVPPGWSLIGSYSEIRAWVATEICTQLVEKIDEVQSNVTTANRLDIDSEKELLLRILEHFDEPVAAAIAS